MRRSVRTVQRWERNYGLPVHRPAGEDRSAVMAIPEELDHWAASTPLKDENDELHRRVAQLEMEIETLKESLSKTGLSTILGGLSPRQSRKGGDGAAHKTDGDGKAGRAGGDGKA